MKIKYISESLQKRWACSRHPAFVLKSLKIEIIRGVFNESWFVFLPPKAVHLTGASRCMLCRYEYASVKRGDTFLLIC